MMFEISAEQGAINTLYPVLSPENKETGEYYNEGIKQEPSKVANDQEVADKLWKVSEQLLRERDNDDEWIKKKIKDVEYSEFKDVKEIGKRGFGVVNRVATNDGMQVALKSIIEKKTSKLEDDDIKKFVNEIKLVRMVGFHQCQWLSWNIKGIFALCRCICGGYREEPIEGTLLEYSQLYQKCWGRDTTISRGIEIATCVFHMSQLRENYNFPYIATCWNDMMVVIIINNNDDGSADGDDDGDGDGDRDRSSGAKGKTDIKFSL
ncbi:retinol dehydrogenase 12-like protein [Rhizophagus irregularis DAOM 181602=DAOM 197198]|nr:retinol dehydrogenase 12-like protein [Rhizophagus irregularis DAOM 181602=DAOM 197198]